MKEALYYKKKDDGIICLLCPQSCYLKEGQRGLCRVRRVEEGKLYSLNYGKVGAMALDPIEKKPLYHFYPGSQIFSLGTAGCNLSCGFCQNWQLARGEGRDAKDLSPNELTHLLKKESSLQNQLGVAYTYAEPSVWYEYILDCAPTVRKLGMKNVLITNGYINPEPLEEILPFIDAVNIDVKAFTEDFYKRNCSGSLEPVLKTVKRAVESCHVEITYLLIPGENDSERELNLFADWLGNLDRDIPLHFSRYFPNYKMEKPPTSPATLYAARSIAQKYLNYIYIGNMPGDDYANSYCPCCSHLLVKRKAHSIEQNFEGDFCPDCGDEVGHAFLKE